MEKYRSKRIVFFSRSLEVGGMEKALLSLLNELAKKEYDITLYLESCTGALLDRLDGRIKLKEYRLSTINFPLIRKTINLLHRLLWTAKNRNKYDFSCCFATYSLICGKLALASSENSSLYVHSDYLGYYQKNKKLTEDFLRSIFISEYKNVFFVSNESMENTASVFPELADRFSVVNNIIDPDKVIARSGERADTPLENGCINLLYVGRLDDSSKDFKLMLKSFEKAHEQNPALRLYLIGDGPDKGMIESFIDQNGIGQVYLLGEKKNPYPYIKACDAMILTSKYEGYPVVYTEALILNKPFITTVPVSDGVIDVRDHFTIADGTVESISEAMMRAGTETADFNIDFKRINRERLLKFEKKINERTIK